MRRSATYFALTTYSIPSFGLETSKDLPTLYHKVKYQLLAIEEILREFELEAVFPSPRVITPVLYWVEFLKNGKDTIRVNGNTNLRLNPGDKIVVKGVFANYSTGLSANILKWGKINDVDNEYTFNGNVTTILVKKNHLAIGKVFLKKFYQQSIQVISVDVNGELKKIPNWGKIEVKAGEYFDIKDTEPHYQKPRFDVRGFSLPSGHRDDSNVKIYTENLLKKYSFKKKGEIYFVKIYNGKRFAGGFQVEVLKKQN
jgi:hypothetical protein